MGSKERRLPEIELNLAGGLPLTITEGGIYKLVERAKKSGFSSFCFLPFRGLTQERAVERMGSSGILIAHIEDAWNPTRHNLFLLAVASGLLGYARRFLGDRSEPPIVQDAFFPEEQTGQGLVNELMRAFPEAKFVSYSINFRFEKKRCLLGIHPGLGMGPGGIVEFAKQVGVGLVFDPSHLLSKPGAVSYPGRPTQETSPWEQEFEFFASSGKLEVVDIHPATSKERKDLFEGRGVLVELARAAKKVGSIRYLRVELAFPPQDLLAVFQREGRFPILSQVAQALKEA